MNYTIYEENGKQMILREVYPRFVGEITFGQSSDIENVQFIDKDAGVMELAAAMREAGEYLLQVSKEKSK